jgi:hypothetical protein
MPVDRELVVNALRPDEPRYAAMAQLLGDDAAPVLAELAEGEDAAFASKAAALASYLSPDSARLVLQRAVRHQDPVVRVAAAAALERQPELVDEMMGRVLTDSDLGVRKWALRSVQVLKPRGWRAQVEALASAEELPVLRELAREVVQQLPP